LTKTSGSFDIKTACLYHWAVQLRLSHTTADLLASLQSSSKQRLKLITRHQLIANKRMMRWVGLLRDP